MPNDRRSTIRPVEIATRDGSDEPTHITGYAAVYYDGTPGTEYVVGTMRERISPGAFDRAIAEQSDVVGLYNHSMDNLLGRSSAGTLAITTDDHGLRYSITIDPTDPDHQRILPKLKRGDVRGSSFAFMPHDGGDTMSRNADGQIIREISSVELFDVGPVTSPAYEGTQAGLRCKEFEKAEQTTRDAQEALECETRLRVLTLDEE